MPISITSNYLKKDFMKRYSIYTSIVLFVALGVILTGCYKDIITQSDPDGPPQQVSFKDELIPIFTKNCALAGCHVAGAHTPELTEAKAYSSLNNGVYVNTLIPKQSKLYEMINGEMSTYIPSAIDKKKVFDWIRNGAPNN
jgi:hypothetical protein